MSTTRRKAAAAGTVAETVRRRVEAGGERVWRLADFEGLAFTAVAQSLSRLARRGVLQRLGKGLYYRPRPTVFGPSKPNPAQLQSLPVRRRGMFPAGTAAAHLLGFTTQSPARAELATDGLSLPRLIVGRDAVIHTRRPEAWRALSETDAALLEFLRLRGAASELSPQETVHKLLGYLAEEGRFERLLRVAASEPPRVRAMLGAIGQQLGQPEGRLTELRKGLNPLSRFDFGTLAALECAGRWQAKERRPRETV
jgi:hypothetical protein